MLSADLGSRNESAISSSAVVEKKNSDTITFIATLQEADAPNRNGRIYPKRLIEREVKKICSVFLIKAGNAVISQMGKS